jgi:translation initiation factor 1
MKKNTDKNGFVYSTNPNFNFETSNEELDTLPPPQQKIRIQLETKHRGGKTVSIVFGFIGKDNDLQTLAKQLKNFCGTGGSAKDGEIVIQGDHREKMLQWFLKNGYSQAKKAGG